MRAKVRVTAAQAYADATRLVWQSYMSVWIARIRYIKARRRLDRLYPHAPKPMREALLRRISQAVGHER